MDKQGCLICLVSALLTISVAAAQVPAESLAPKSATVIQGGYLFNGMLARGDGSRVHMVFYRAQKHNWGKPSFLGYAVSEDDGKTWTERPNLAADRSGKVEDRFWSFGRLSSGRLIVMFTRRMVSNGAPTLGQIQSDDDGRTWSIFHKSKIVAEVPDGLPVAGAATFGSIKTTPSGRAVVMAYAPPNNFVLISDNGGQTWTSTRIVQSKDVHYNEMALDIVDDRKWIAVSRINDARSSMAEFMTEDGGRTWSFGSPLSIPASTMLVAPSISRIEIKSQSVPLLSYCDRLNRYCGISVGKRGPIPTGRSEWSLPVVFDRIPQTLSGYQSILPSKDGRDLIVSNTYEIGAGDARIAVWRIPVARVVPAH